MQSSAGHRISPLQGFLCALLIAVGICGCPSTQPGQPTALPQMAAGSEHLIILSAGSVRAILDPQDDQGRSLGGFGRRGTYLQLTRQSGIDPVVLDAGDLLFSAAALPRDDKRRRADLDRAALIIELLNLSGLDAYVPGEIDMAAGWEQFSALRSSASFPFLAANLVQEAGSPALDAFVVINRGEIKLGVFGLVSPTLFAQTPAVLYEGLSVSDPVTAGRKAVHDLRNRGVDLIIALTHLDPAQLETVARDVPGINLALSGHSASGDPPLNTALHGLPVISAGSGNTHLARLDVFLLPTKSEGGASRELLDGTQGKRLRQSFDEANRELLRIERDAGQGSIDDFLAQRPEQHERYGRLLAQRSTAAEQLGAIMGRDHFVFSAVALDRTIGRDRQIEETIMPWRIAHAPDTIPNQALRQAEETPQDL
ncbi:MAG: hypothetical protein P9M14_12285 [Candidatus Alcyoniella australis]|nr:hypothetical protein [Candidatus Alcyoniella australis]